MYYMYREAMFNTSIIILNKHVRREIISTRQILFAVNFEHHPSYLHMAYKDVLFIINYINWDKNNVINISKFHFFLRLFDFQSSRHIFHLIQDNYIIFVELLHFDKITENYKF